MPELAALEPLHFNNYVTRTRARVKGSKDTQRTEFLPLLERAKSTLAESGSSSMKANLNGVVVELSTNSAHQAEFWSHNWWKADDGSVPRAKIYSAIGL